MNKALINIDEEDDPIFDSDDDARAAKTDKLTNILKQVAANEDPSNERKEKLKIRLLNESQTYYQNNLNIFSNGLSLLSVNSLEVHGLVHQIHGQTEEMNKLANNIEAHTSFMKTKTSDILDKLKKIENKI